MTHEILKQVIHNKAHVQIGKNGVSEGVINQIKQRLKKNIFIKIKFLNCNDHFTLKEMIKDISDQTNSKIVDIRGKTAIIMDLKKEI